MSLYRANFTDQILDRPPQLLREGPKHKFDPTLQLPFPGVPQAPKP